MGSGDGIYCVQHMEPQDWIGGYNMHGQPN
jgi:hypothetical protein